MAKNEYEEILEKTDKEMLKKDEEIKELQKKKRKLLAEKRKLEKELHQKHLAKCGAILEKVNPSLINISDEDLTEILSKILSSDVANEIIQDFKNSKE